jgi:hypothetical protein
MTEFRAESARSIPQGLKPDPYLVHLRQSGLKP